MSYSAIILDRDSRKRLVSVFRDTWEQETDSENWTVYAHHMTITMGLLKGELRQFLGQEVELRVTGFAGDDKVKAVSIETSVPSKNAIPHVTLAVNKANGGKPVMSNNLTNWIPVMTSIILKGIVQEVIT